MIQREGKVTLSLILSPIWFQIVESIRYDKFHDELFDVCSAPYIDINRPLSKCSVLGLGPSLTMKRTGMKRLGKNKSEKGLRSKLECKLTNWGIVIVMR